MKLIDRIRNSNHNSKWIVDNFNNNLLFIDNSFQRRYVWLKKHKISLIETILMGYAIPEIYIWKVETDPDTGNSKHSIVDGQQRIGALTSFINDEFALQTSVLSDDNKKASFAGKKFSELAPEDKNKIWDYPFSIRVISDEVKKEEIVNLFLRLNSTDKTLNPQELRNAEFNGKFLETAEEIANNSFWSDFRIFSPNSLRRMGDIEFVSSLLVFLRLGISSELDQTSINIAYNMFEEVYEESEQDKKTIFQILDIFRDVFNYSSDFLPFFKKMSHFYTLFTVIYKSLFIMNKEITEEVKKKLQEFCLAYENQNCTQSDIVEYKRYSVEGTHSKTSRIKRTEILSKYLGI